MDELKFQPGDRVRRRLAWHNGMSPGDEDVVVEFLHTSGSGWHLEKFGKGHAAHNLDLVERAKPATGEPVYAGHHPDGSSIQNHSAGPLYPYVLIWRDKKGGPDAHGKYDVGVIGPRISGPVWFNSLDGAVKIAEVLKEMKWTTM